MRKIISRILWVLLTVFLLIQVWFIGSLIWWKDNPVQTTNFMRIAYYSNMSQPIKHYWRDYQNISPYLAQAIIAAEDASFLDHSGFDWSSIQNALMDNHQEGQIVRGGSTISQQLIKNLFLYNQRSWLRKGQEAIGTVMMEQLWDKRRILEVYMNSVEFGKHIYGAEAAAQYYFGKKAKYLNREQAAFLAAILPRPKYYQNNRTSAKLRQRQQQILQRMKNTSIPK